MSERGREGVTSYFYLLGAIAVICASIIPLYLGARVYGTNRAFAALSVLLGFALIAHGVYRYWVFAGDYSLGVRFEFASALMVFSLTMYYTYLNRRSAHAS